MATRVSLLSIVALAAYACIEPAPREGRVPPPLPEATCDFEGLATSETSFFPEGGGYLASIVTNDERGNTLYVEFWSGATLAVGSYQLGASEEERDRDTCTVCVLGVRVAGDAETEFFATAGTLEVESFDMTSLRFLGSLTDATLVETSHSPYTGTVEVEDGQRWCIPSLDFDAPAAFRRTP